MPKIQYKEINFRGKSLDLINLVNQVINEYKNQGYELTLIEVKSEPVQDGTTNTDSESVTLKADAYFYVPADDNYVMKHKGDTVDLIVDGVEVMKVITREEFNAGIKRLAQENNPVPADAQTPAEPLDGAMNPPEQHVRGQRRRRTR